MAARLAPFVKSAAVAAALLAVAAGARAADGVRVGVSPARGTATTRFTVSFVAPARTGVVGSRRLREELIAENPTAASGCDAGAVRYLAPVRRGQRVRVVLAPGSPAAVPRWCTGSFEGRLLELETAICPPRSLCPAYERVRTLGTFAFVVRG